MRTKKRKHDTNGPTRRLSRRKKRNKKETKERNVSRTRLKNHRKRVVTYEVQETIIIYPETYLYD